MKSSVSTARLERGGVGGRDERVAGDRDQRPHLALARGRDLLGEADDRAARRYTSGRPLTRLVQRPTCIPLPTGPRAGRVALPDRGEREHRAALAIEVAGQVVEHVDEPARERAEALRRGPDPRVDRGALGGGELARHAADLAGLDPAARGATASGVNGSASSAIRSAPFACSASAPGSARPSSSSTLAIANSSSASVPGRMKWCSEASRAVRLRRGSMTTTLPPRSRIARIRPRMSGAVSSEPLETSGLAPRISRWSVRSTSGTGTLSAAAEHQPRPRPASASGRRSMAE